MRIAYLSSAYLAPVEYYTKSVERCLEVDEDR